MIRRAPTDSERRITYDPLARPAVANLLDLLAATTGEDPRRLADEIGNAARDDSSRCSTEAVNELPPPVRQRRAGLADDHSYLDGVLDTGNARARRLADHTLMTVHNLLGSVELTRTDRHSLRRHRRSMTARLSGSVPAWAAGVVSVRSRSGPVPANAAQVRGRVDGTGTV